MLGLLDIPISCTFPYMVSIRCYYHLGVIQALFLSTLVCWANFGAYFLGEECLAAYLCNLCLPYCQPVHLSLMSSLLFRLKMGCISQVPFHLIPHSLWLTILRFFCSWHSHWTFWFSSIDLFSKFRLSNFFMIFVSACFAQIILQDLTLSDV